jgi:hypothetical protein
MGRFLNGREFLGSMMRHCGVCGGYLDEVSNRLAWVRGVRVACPL